MRSTPYLSALALAAITLAAPAEAQVNQTDAVVITRDMIQAEKRAIVAANMDLTEAESAAFWPVYDAFQGELMALGKRQAELVAGAAPSWGALDAKSAETLVKGILDHDKARADLFRKYWGRFTKAVPAGDVARYYQIERKLRAIMDYELADAVPLVGPARGG